MSQIKHIDLEELEKAVYSRDHNHAGIALLSAMQRIKTGAEFAWKRQDPESLAGCYARLACAIGAFICDPDYVPSDEGYQRLCLEAPTFEAIFMASPLKGAHHLARVLADNPNTRDPSKLEWNDMASLAKWMIFCGLDSPIGTNYDELFGKAARVMFPLWISLLTTKIVYTSLAMERKNALLKMGHYFEDLDIPDVLLSALSDAYMYTSYATDPARHEVKATMMRLYANAIKKRTKIPAVTRITGRGKPTILIPIEWFGSFHAMHRCYAPVVDQLRQDFRVVACARNSMLDDNARAYFDKVLPIPEAGTDLSTLIKNISELAPDIIFYPSVGMALWWVALASLRLAPIQIMSVGHPASSYSPEMDYVITDEEAIEPKCFTEQPVMLPPGLHFTFVERPDYAAIERPPRSDTAIRIAVPAIAMKLNPSFFDALTRVEIAAKEKSLTIEYHFFANLLGAEHRRSYEMLRKMFEGCVAHPRIAAPEYLKRMAACDFALAPFPFGGTNSTIDALLLDLPVVALWGEQPHERFDSLMLKKIGCDHLIAKTVDEYVDLCLALCEEEPRDLWSKRIKAADCGKAFYGPLPSPAWSKAFRYIYDHHEEIKQRGGPIHWKDFLGG